ncbi:MAG: ComEC family competence protein, partial [Rubrivivax sp.]
EVYYVMQYAMQTYAQLSELGHWKQVLRPHLGILNAAVGGMLGAGVFFYLPFDPWWGWGLAVGLLGLGLCALPWLRVSRVGVAAFWGGLAFLLAAGQVARVVELDYAAAQKPKWIVGRVVEIVEKDEKPNRATVRLEDVESYGLGGGAIARAGIGVYRSQIQGVQVGETLAMPVVLMAPEGPKFKGQRDGRVWSYFADARVGGYVVGTVEPSYRPEAPTVKGRLDGVLKRVEDLRQRIYERSKDLAGGAVAALLVGEEKGIGHELRDAYRATGLSHLLAISGMQMTIVALGLYAALRWMAAAVPGLALRVDVRIPAAIVAMGGTLFYTLLAGGSVSLVRSSIMAGIVLLAVVTGRVNSSVRAWAMAALLIVVLNPVMVTRAGFQLSVVAVGALILLAQMRTPRHPLMGNGVIKWSYQLLLATIVAGAATAPVTVAQFGQFTAIGMLANLVAVPVMALATYIGMLTLLVWPLGLAEPVLGWMGVVVGWVNSLALTIQDWPAAAVNVEKGLWPLVAAVSVFVVGMVLARMWLWVALGVAVLTGGLVGIAHMTPKPDVMVWGNGEAGLERDGDGYALLWAENAIEVGIWARMAGVKLVPTVEPATSVDERYMPTTEHEHFAWAERVDGRWHVEPYDCRRVWQRVAVECK